MPFKPGITLQLIIVNIVLVGMFAAMSMFMYISFGKVEQLVNRSVTTDVKSNLASAGILRELTGIFSQVNHLSGNFIKNEQELEKQGAQIVATADRLAADSGNRKLSEPLHRYTGQLRELFSSCAAINTSIRTVEQLELQHQKETEALESTINDAKIKLILKGQDSGIMDQLSSLSIGLQSSLQEISLFFYRTISDKSSPKDATRLKQLLAKIDAVTLQIKALTAAEPAIAIYAPRLTASLKVYRSEMERFFRLQERLGAQSNQLESTKEKVLDVMRQMDQELSATTGETGHHVHDIMITSRRYLLVTALLLALFSGIVTSLCIYFKIQRPMQLINAGIGNFAAGNLDARISLNRTDEWGNIETALNIMAEELSTSYRDLAQRTVDLSVANKELEDEISERQTAQEQLQEQTVLLKEEIDERRRVQEELTKSEQRFRAIFDQTFQMIGLLTPQGNLLEANKTALDFCGIDESAVLGLPFWESPWWPACGGHREKVRDAIHKAAAGTFVRFETVHQAADGKLHMIDFSLKPVLGPDGEVVMLIPEGRDITETKKLEQEIRQLHKMEAIGTLAGGIAHDFNNILTAIIGYTDMALRKLPDNDMAVHDLEQVQVASSRAKDLVSRILTFSRLGEHEVKPVKVSSIIDEVLKLLRSSLPATIEIQKQIDTSQYEDIVLADQTQLHQVLVNLGTNAAHAMRAEGGTLAISLSAIEVDATLRQLHPDLAPGPFVRLTVTDTGHGMTNAVKVRIFDPYFTTKEAGEGTGMGLALVQGIIKGHGGAISVYSEPGQGTAFHILLPRIQKFVAQGRVEDGPLHGGTERILFVDDEEILSRMGCELLESLGYRVTATSSSLEALQLFKANPAAFDLVITDMTMPKLTGKQLAEKIFGVRPDIPIILCTGFCDLLNEKQAKEIGIREFVMKPYVLKGLDKTIRRALA